MTNNIESLAQTLAGAAASFDAGNALRPRGVVRRVGDGVAMVAGLDDVAFEELIAFDCGAFGLAYDLREEAIGAVLLTGGDLVSQGDGAVGLGRLPQLPVGTAVLGRIINPLGHPLDEGPPLPAHPVLPLFRLAPGIVERQRVRQPLWTGVSAVDAAIPIGRGQRELIIGDRNVGKTALALDFVAAQKPGDVACVYVVIGQSMSRVLTLRQTLEQAGCWENTVLVAAVASDTPGMQYLAPYAGASVAEWFRDQGGHAVVIFDDLTKHADAYRELALLLDRPPGREAYPGDIFYIHAELLERATAMRDDLGGGSVTAFPIIETTDSDISAYIPTNLISITDGQIYLDTGRFEKNLRPAIDVGRSVSRIGAMAQPPAMQQAARNLRIALSRFESVEKLARVGLEMDAATQAVIRNGNVMRQLLRQDRLSPRSIAQQFIALTAVNENWLEDVPPERARAVVDALCQSVRSDLPKIMATLESGEAPTQDQVAAIQPLAARAQQQADDQARQGTDGPAPRQTDDTAPQQTDAPAPQQVQDRQP